MVGVMIFVIETSILTGVEPLAGRVVISMTTLPIRLHLLPKVLATLLAQDAKVDAIWVHVSTTGVTDFKLFQRALFDTCGGVFTSQLGAERLQCGIMHFVFATKDWGPATKLLGVLPYERDPETRIITVDDDILYDKQMVSTLLRHENAGKRGALGFSCEEMPREPSHHWRVVSGAYGWMYPFSRTLPCRGWLHGYQGVLYRRSFFGDDAFALNLTRGCYFADDVRLAGYLANRGIPRRVYPHFVHWGWAETFTVLPKNNTAALSLIPDTMLHNQWPCVRSFHWW